jgi:hypothetical protein
MNNIVKRVKQYYKNHPILTTCGAGLITVGVCFAGYLSYKSYRGSSSDRSYSSGSPGGYRSSYGGGGGYHYYGGGSIFGREGKNTRSSYHGS